MNHQLQGTLYIVKEITVESGLESEYIEFLKALEKYIQVKYAKYYSSLQLYKNSEEDSKFFMTVSYKSVDGIYDAIIDIENDVTSLYENVYGDKIQRKVVFSFDTVERLIPQY